MGQFSWITQDTNEAVREKYGCLDLELTSAYLHDDKGNVWEEKEYEGYGVFGGKDYYVLLAEMNIPSQLKNLSEDEIRLKGIDLVYSGKDFKSPNITRFRNWKWVNESPKDDPNQGWGEW